MQNKQITNVKTETENKSQNTDEIHSSVAVNNTIQIKPSQTVPAISELLHPTPAPTPAIAPSSSSVVQ